MRKIFIFACLCIASSIAQCQSLDFDQMVLAGEKAYAMSPPDSLGNSVFSQIGWSSDGKYLFGLRSEYLSPLAVMDLKATGKPPSLKQELVVYNLARHSTKVVYACNYPQTMIENAEWMSGSSALFITTLARQLSQDKQEGEITKSVVRIDAASGRSDEVVRMLIDDEHDMEVELAPNFAGGLLQRQTIIYEGPSKSPVRETTYSRIDGQGRIIEGIAPTRGFYFIGWAEDGKTAAFNRFEKPANGKYRQSLHLYDLGTNSMVESPGHFERAHAAPTTVAAQQHAPQLPEPTVKGYAPPTDSLPVMAVQLKATGTSTKASTQLRPYIMVSRNSDESSALIVGDAQFVIFSPTLSGVAYISQGVAMVRPISELPRGIYEAALKASLKTKAIINAKQVGTALIMHASDNDDVYIGGKADLRQELGPYLKDPSTLDGFVYTFGGGSVTDIESPADTVIGYTVGPGGRAELYADGHVKWRDDK